jgi:predicted adenylyl cyclase CyaB
VAEELEVKAAVDDVPALRARLAAARARPGFAGRMEDRRYDRDGELTARDEVLRVRTFLRGDGSTEARVSWKGPTRAEGGYKRREEIELAAEGAESPAALLERLGYAVVHAIDREVEYYTLGGATVRLERYPRMDVLLEIEGDAGAIERAVRATGMPRAAFTTDALADFAARYEARTGRPALLAGAVGPEPAAEPAPRRG